MSETPNSGPAADAAAAKDAAKDTALDAKNKAADVASTGKQAASDVAGTAADAAKDVAAETKKQASDLVGTTRQQLTEQAEVQQSALVSTLRDLGDQLASMTDDNDKDGTAVELATQARDRARSAADWLDGRSPADVVEELRKVGRERPGAFLLGALTAGIVAGRLTRGVVDVHTGSSDGSPTTGSDTSAAPSPATYSAPSSPSPLAAGGLQSGRHEAPRPVSNNTRGTS